MKISAPMGFVFQEFNLLDTFSLEDNIYLPLVLAGAPYEEMRRRLIPIAKIKLLAAVLPAADLMKNLSVLDKQNAFGPACCGGRMELYFPYLLSGIVMVMVFYILAFLAASDMVHNLRGGEGMTTRLICGGGLSLFQPSAQEYGAGDKQKVGSDYHHACNHHKPYHRVTGIFQAQRPCVGPYDQHQAGLWWEQLASIRVWRISLDAIILTI